jgi:hypothetical protein
MIWLVTSGTKELTMLDVLFVALTLVFFGLTYLSILGLERLKGGES